MGFPLPESCDWLKKKLYVTYAANHMQNHHHFSIGSFLYVIFDGFHGFLKIYHGWSPIMSCLLW